MISNEIHLAEINSPARSIKGKVALYGATLSTTFSYSDALKDFAIDRVGEDGKFFGFGICQKLTVKLLDKNREITIEKGDRLIPYLGIVDSFEYTTTFYATEITRDEKTNTLTIIAYDAIYDASPINIKEADVVVIADNIEVEDTEEEAEELVDAGTLIDTLTDEETTEEVEEITNGYTVLELLESCTKLLKVEGVTILGGLEASAAFTRYYEEGINLSGSESIRDILNAIAEATQTIYYIHSDVLIFKRLDRDGDAVLQIGKDAYFTLENGGSHTLSAIAHTTELGDNVIASTEDIGVTQYVRNNPFWELRDDIATIVDEALANIGGISINQFNCKWRGNYLLEIGDKIEIVTKDDEVIVTYLLNDTITYNGGLVEVSSWSYTDSDNESLDNPTSLGEVIKQTYARVDKANRQIELLAKETSANNENIANLQLTTEGIVTSVSQMETNTNEALDTVNSNIETLTNQVSATMSAEAIEIKIQEAITDGASSVTTETGFTFNDDGLTIEKANSEMKTQITEDGMTVYKDDEEVLTANNTGVNAVNLHAKTYLIIGTYSRLEDYADSNGNGRTGCFWIGGNE